MTGSSLLSRLRPFGRRMLTVGIATGIGWGLVAALLVVSVGMWLDLVLELPARVRIASGGMAVAFFVVLILFAGWSAVRRSLPGRLARRLDHVAGTGGEILSGVDLSRARSQLSGVTAGLAEIAVHRATNVAAGVPAAAAVPARPMGWAFGSLAGLCIAGGVIAMLAPDLASKQWARFIHPRDDHPPYSPLVFEVQPGNVEKIYGEPLDINVKVSGGTVDRVDLILQTADASEPETLPMFPEPDGGWRTTIAQVTATGTYYAQAHRGRSNKFDLKIITVPRIEDVRFRVTPPAYTRMPPYEGPLPQGGLAGLPGARVEVWIESNRPLSGGTMQIVTDRHDDRLAMTTIADGPKEVKGDFEIREPGKVHMKVIDVDGQPSKDTFTASITLLTDERPFVRLLEPQTDAFATPSVELPVALSAEDDYGVSRVQLYRSLNDSRALPMDLDERELTPTRHYETVSLPLADYGLKPGDEMKFYARVEDNDPAGAKGSESPVVAVRIISQAEYERWLRVRHGMEVLQSKYQQAQRRMENILDEIEKLQKKLDQEPPDSELSKEMQKELDRLVQQMRNEASAIRLAAQMKLPYDLDAKLNPELEKLAKMLEKAAKELEKANKGKGSSFPKAGGMSDKLKELAKACGGGKKEFEKEVTEPLEHLAKILPLLQDEARFLTLYGQQKDLAERLASLKGRDGEDDPQLKARMRDMEEEQRKLREELEQLLDDIENHVAQLPEDPRLDDLRDTASKFAADLRNSGAAEAMSKAEQGLAEFAGTLAHKNAKEAAEILSSFIGRCGGMGKGGRSCLKFQPKLSSCLGNTVAQLLAEAGMQTGFGMGMGAGGGYSASRSTAQNTPMYGNMPTLGDMTRFGSGKSGLFGGRGRGLGTRGNETDPSVVDPSGTLQATTGGATAVPVRYRSRVGAYLQRIADEIGE